MSHFPAVKFIDDLGAAYGIPKYGGSPSVVAQSYLQSIAEGDITGHTPWSKIGYTPSMTTTESDIWGAAGVYVFPTAAQQMEVVSSSASDTGAVIFSGTTSGGSSTSLVDATKNFTAGTPVAVGDCILLDGTGTPEWGYVTGVAATTLDVAGGFSAGGSANERTYKVLDFSATTGAQAVRVEYLDNTYSTRVEFVVLNGTTAVPTVATDIRRINAFRVTTAGSNLKAVGNLSIRAIADTPVFSYIQAGYTRARNSMYTIPAGKTLYVVKIETAFATSGNANKEYARIYTRANVEPGTQFNTGNLFYAYTDIVMQNTTINTDLWVPTRFPAKTDIRISGIASSTGTATSVLRGWME